MKVPKRAVGKPFNAQRRSLKQESELAKRVGGKVTRGSGRGVEKGDVRIKGLARIEAKTTSNSSFQLKKEMVAKLELSSSSSGEIPAIVIEFLNQNGKPTHELAVIPMWALLTLLSQANATP